jgi:hypothetical protein
MHASPPAIHGKSRMRERACTDLSGGRSATVVPTATIRKSGLDTVKARISNDKSAFRPEFLVAHYPTRNCPTLIVRFIGLLSVPFDALRKVLTNPKKDSRPAAARRRLGVGACMGGCSRHLHPASSTITGRAALLPVNARAIVVPRSLHTSGLHLATKQCVNLFAKINR